MTIVIAWAGNVVFARTVITELRALASQAPLSMPIIQTYLAHLDPTMKDQVSFVRWVRDGEVFHQFWYRAGIAESAMFGRVSATFASHVVLVHSPKDITVFNRIDYSESRASRSISFSLEDRHISFGISRQFSDELTQSVRAGFADF